MDITAYVQSGIIENYCLGFCSAAEAKEVEVICLQHPAIKIEIDKLREPLEAEALLHAVPASPAIKIAVMRAVYKQQAAIDIGYAPLIEEKMVTAVLEKWVTQHHIELPVEKFDNLFLTELPSTEKLVNFIIAAKQGHEEEVHNDFTEYVYIISGSCTMIFNEEERHYVAGDLISILPRMKHAAIVTSAAPMLALVQRQWHV